MLVCCVCKNSYFHSCEDYTISELRTMKNKRGASWSCRNCNVVSNDINELRAAILTLKNEILSRERSTTIAESAFEEIINEINDRNNRKQNIVLFNVPEPISQNADERKEHDRTTTLSILRSLPTDVDLEGVQINRVGRFVPNAGRHRPIKVRLNGVRDVHNLIKNARNLKSSNEFKHIHISMDKTKRQNEYYKKVKAELDLRAANGEVGLRIRYDGGVPTIVSSSLN